MRAGYSVKAARAYGSVLLNNPAVKAAIKVAISQRAQRTEVKADRVVQELARLGFANMLD